MALLLIVGVVLAFPLAYLLNEELRNQNTQVVLFLVEAVIVAVLIGAMRSRRRL